jgi:short-subunit dehydrogenase
MVINCSGILNTNGIGERSIKEVDFDNMMYTFKVNAIGPTILAKNIMNNLNSNIKWINISARVGSIGDNRLGGWYT